MPKSSSSGPQNAKLERAALALRMQDFAEAERLAAEVQKAERGNIGAAVILGQALLATNRANEAVAPLERAARRAGDAGIETLLATALAASGRSQDALDRLQQATTRRPAYAPAFIEYARQLGRAMNVDDAIAVAAAGVALLPEVVELKVEFARLLVASNERARARGLLLQAKAAAPGHPDVLAELARVMVLDGEYADAAELYRRTLAVRPDAITRANFALCLLELNDRDGAEAQFREVVRGNPQLFGRAVSSMAVSSHGRFFMRPSMAAAFLND
jgi:tetratricopeptide (TPR) repeat protein